MLHLERKGLFVEHKLGRPASLDHESASEVSVECGDGAEELEKVAPVLGVEYGRETGVDEDERRLIAVRGDGGELR